MKAEDLLIIGAIGAGAYFWWQSTQTAAASGTPATSAAPISTAPTNALATGSTAAAPLNPLPMAPSINVQPSTAPLANPLLSATPPPNPIVSIMPIGAPVQFVPVNPVPNVTTTTGTPTPPPTVQPGIVTVAPAPVATITPNPIATPPVPVSVPAAPVSMPAPYVPPPVYVAPYVAPAPPAAPAPIVYNPAFSFTTSSGNNSLDTSGGTWTASITGAPPNAPVSMQLTDPTYTASTNQVGYTDANGNFSYTGTVGNATTIGLWSQKWYVLMPDNSQRVVGTATLTIADSLVGLLPTVNPGGTPYGFTGYNPYSTPVVAPSPLALANSGGLTPWNI